MDFYVITFMGMLSTSSKNLGMIYVANQPCKFITAKTFYAFSAEREPSHRLQNSCYFLPACMETSIYASRGLQPATRKLNEKQWLPITGKLGDKI
jgi:hypothetical protein